MNKVDSKKYKKVNGYKLSYAQRRMFVLYKLEPNSSFYNINNIRDIIGDFEIDKLQKAVNKIIERHEIFRTNFKEINGEPVQIIKEKKDLRFKIYDLKEIKNTKKREERERDIVKIITQKPFRLETDFLLRVAIIKKNEKKHTLVLSMHHIISDSWSINLFYKELKKIYDALIKNKKLQLKKIVIQYKDYAEWEQSNKNSIG
jgi:NRPS condensation-like uncharacterized protein